MSTAAGALAAGRPQWVAVVIPAKDEEQRIEQTVRSVLTMDRVDLVVVVDDGSSDATSAVARGAGAIVVRHPSNQGKAAAMATGARVVAMREEADRASGGEDFREELHAEPRVPGHTGPLPVIDPAGGAPRALLFLDADMGASAAGAAPLIDAVLDDGVDMAIALLPPQVGAAGMGIVVRTARSGIARATGWEPEQPLSGTRCITREAWDECQPLAPGWGVETSLSIDALAGGFWVKEIPCELHHRATGKDLRGQLHRAAQLRDVLRALRRRRAVRPPYVADEDAVGVEATAESSSVSAPEAAEPRTDPSSRESPDLLASLPVTSEFSQEDLAQLGDADLEVLDRELRALPVDGLFDPDEIAFLASVDLRELADRLDRAPVEGGFSPEDAVIIGAHLGRPAPEVPEGVATPMTSDEYASFVVQAAVDAADAEGDAHTE